MTVGSAALLHSVFMILTAFTALPSVSVTASANRLLSFVSSRRVFTRHLQATTSFIHNATATAEGMGTKNNSGFKVLGVCGGIGSGKSQACKLLVSELNCAAHLDADSLAHQVYTPGSVALSEIAKEFGSQVLQEDGQLNRKELGSIVFSDASKMSTLERIVWPHVREVIINRIAEIRDDKDAHDDKVTPVIVLEAAIMLDAGWDDLVDGMWAVRAPLSVIKERLVSQRGMELEDTEKRIAAQQKCRGIGNVEEELNKGIITAVIENDGSLEDLITSLRNALLDCKSWKDGVAPSMAVDATTKSNGNK